MVTCWLVIVSRATAAYQIPVFYGYWVLKHTFVYATVGCKHQTQSIKQMGNYK